MLCHGVPKYVPRGITHSILCCQDPAAAPDSSAAGILEGVPAGPGGQVLVAGGHGPGEGGPVVLDFYSECSG